MRRATTCQLAAAVMLLALTAAAQAAPTVTVRGEAVPIPGFPDTGNIYGAGAAVKAEVEISGTEYGGFPPPLIGVNVSFPKGTKLHPGPLLRQRTRSRGSLGRTVLRRGGRHRVLRLRPFPGVA